MLEIGFVVFVVAAAALVIGRLRHGTDHGELIEEDFVDLPCPWCQAPTRETDTACPSCHEPFAVRHSA